MFSGRPGRYRNHFKKKSVSKGLGQASRCWRRVSRRIRLFLAPGFLTTAPDDVHPFSVPRYQFRDEFPHVGKGARCTLGKGGLSLARGSGGLSPPTWCWSAPSECTGVSPQIARAPWRVPLRPEKRRREDHEQPEQPEQPVQPEQFVKREQPELPEPEQGSRSSQSKQVAEDEGVESESLDAFLLRASQQALLVHLDLASKHLADVSQMTDGELGSLVIVNKLVSFTERLLAACPQLSAGSLKLEAE